MEAIGIGLEALLDGFDTSMSLVLPGEPEMKCESELYAFGRDAKTGAWSKEPSICRNARHCLREIFQAALRFKASHSITGQVFEFTVSEPGKSHDKGDFKEGTEPDDASEYWRLAELVVYDPGHLLVIHRRFLLDPKQETIVKTE
ncbi:uncharacterized protein PAC_14955 [Phialocephala subalpina]|uniref:Uncharacterized protein n=1 Tax=Phialocephala subalpina TaxID=576137 RepID=A0A1L7XJ34_9HELO|nr:uncharacterized protein PAC_14955 [Phialocephala subalpina]